MPSPPHSPQASEAAARPGYLALTSPVNLAGFPALALPVPSRHRLPASLQLIGGASAEALLLATGATVEAAVSLCSERRPAGFRIAVISEPPPAPDPPRDPLPDFLKDRPPGSGFLCFLFFVLQAD